MTKTSPETVISQLQWRYATKAFDPTKKIPAADWNALEQSLIQSPSSFGLQPWKFIVITDQTIKDKLPELSWGQTQPRDCSHFVVIAVRKELDIPFVDHFIETTTTTRGIPKNALAPYRDMIVGTVERSKGHHTEWNARQAYIALGFLLQTAAILGIDACPMEGILAPKFDELLGLDKEGFTTIVTAAVGYRAADDKYATLKKVRYPTSAVVQHV